MTRQNIKNGIIGGNVSVFDPHHQAQNLDSKVVVALERLAAAFRAELWRKNKETSLSPIQIQILIFLLFHDKGNRTVSALAEEFNVTKATISAAVSSLETKGLVKKHSHSSDQRITPLMLTDKGEKIASETATFSNGILKQIEVIDFEKKKILYETLLGTINRLQQSGVISYSRMCHSCRHFSDNNGKHHCNLLNKSLEPHEMPIDCPEYSKK